MFLTIHYVAFPLQHHTSEHIKIFEVKNMNVHTIASHTYMSVPQMSFGII